MRFLVLLFIAVTANAEVRFHFGNDARWADPNFDDTNWSIVREGIQTLPDFHSDGYSWYRYRLPVPITEEPLGLRVVAGRFVGEVFLDGKKLGGWGTFPPNVNYPAASQRNLSFPLPPEMTQGRGTVLVAMRVWTPFRYRSALGNAPLAEVGPQQKNLLLNALADSNGRNSATPRLYLSLTILFYGIALVILWRAFQNSAEVGLFGLALSCWAALVISDTLPDFFPDWNIVPWFWPNRLLDFLEAATLYWFCWRLFGLRWRYLLLFLAESVWIEAMIATLRLAPVVSPLVELARSWHWVELASDGGFTLIAIWLLVRGVYSRPVMLTIALTHAAIVLTNLEVIPKNLTVNGFTMDTQTLVFVGLLISMSWLLLGRTWRTWREQQELSAEFEAAREMQESLVQSVPDTPGLTVEFAYLPASQVGGDFYRIFPTDNGATLVVVGDVSGKGLKAAMTVAGLVCAMEGIRTRRPGAFLEELNRAASGYMKSGFATSARC